MLVVIRGHGPDGRCDGPSLEECVLLLQKITEHHGGYTAVAAVIFLSLSGGIFGTAVKLGNQYSFASSDQLWPSKEDSQNPRGSGLLVYHFALADGEQDAKSCVLTPRGEVRRVEAGRV